MLKLSTEDSLGAFSVGNPALTSLVIHSADVLNKLHVQQDGQTAYKKVKGRDHTGLLLEFASVVLCKVSANVQGGVMAARWMRGL